MEPKTKRPPPVAHEVEVIWDQPQPGYPAPERPLDSAEERVRAPAAERPERKRRSA